MGKRNDLIRWQHEDTGRVCELPKGKTPGLRWYRIPAEKKPKCGWKAKETAVLKDYEHR